LAVAKTFGRAIGSVAMSDAEVEVLPDEVICD
jgi:hypothetical protein